ncbi:hypothetical protein TRVL_04957 [Trypanosoma vivax]|nr:hypothetical protein TRVL_04957 [Trypanosoma vivax]
MISFALLFIVLCFVLDHRRSKAALDQHTKGALGRLSQSQGDPRVETCLRESSILSEKILATNNALRSVLGDSVKYEARISAALHLREQDDSGEGCQEGTNDESNLARRESGAITDHSSPISDSIGGNDGRMAAFNEALQDIRRVYELLCTSTPGCTLLSDGSLMARWGYASQGRTT